ncbi:hypothetical protein Tco_0462499 [Tanacetum coccineum]
MMLQKRALEAGFNALKLDHAKGTDEADLANLCVEIEDSLKRDEGVFMRVVLAPTPSYLLLLAVLSMIKFWMMTHGEEIDLTLFPLAPGPYHMPYPYEGVSSPLKALDRTITLAELRRTKSLLPLELSNCVNVLSAILVSHGYELNSHYTNLVSSRARLQEKLDQKKGDVRLLRLEVTSLDDKLEKLQGDYDALGQENRELYSQRDATFEDKLLSSDEFHAALARVASLGLNYCVDRGLCMGRTDIEFEAAFQNKIVAASGGTLSDLATSVSVAPSSVNEAPGQVPP